MKSGILQWRAAIEARNSYDRCANGLNGNKQVRHPLNDKLMRTLMRKLEESSSDSRAGPERASVDLANAPQPTRVDFQP